MREYIQFEANHLKILLYYSKIDMSICKMTQICIMLRVLIIKNTFCVHFNPRQGYHNGLDTIMDDIYDDHSEQRPQLTSYPSVDYDSWTDMLKRLGALETFEE